MMEMYRVMYDALYDALCERVKTITEWVALNTRGGGVVDLLVTKHIREYYHGTQVFLYIYSRQCLPC
jgi:hypothetical protein